MTSEPLRTADGSLTFRHPEVGEAYHSLDGAESETRGKFIEPSRLRERRMAGPVRILDIGFGLGLNCRAALACPGVFPLHIDSIEIELLALQRGLMLVPGDPLISALIAGGHFHQHGQHVQIHFGDVRQIVKDLKESYDLIFHDPFSPVRNSECWTVDLFKHFFRLLKNEGALLTYSQSKIVRTGLHEAGFVVQDTFPPPPHRGGTIAVKEGMGLAIESAIPFRDPDLTASGHRIRSRREADMRAKLFARDSFLSENET